jgi:hypothetical protein
MAMEEKRDQERLVRAVQDSLAMLGDNTYEALLFQMKDRYGVDLQNMRLGDFERALRDLFGPGAEIIISSIRQRLG